MKKGNVIEFDKYRDALIQRESNTHQPISKELEEAIESLIDQLRESGNAQ